MSIQYSAIEEHLDRALKLLDAITNVTCEPDESPETQRDSRNECFWILASEAGRSLRRVRALSEEAAAARRQT